MSQIDIKIALWNANGILNHTNEIELFIRMNKIDIMLISETHATDRTYLNIIGFKCIFANHPSNKAFGGAAIIIKASLNFCELQPAVSDAIQAAMVDMQFMNERVIISAVYCRPRFNLKETDFDLLFSNFGFKFIAG